MLTPIVLFVALYAAILFAVWRAYRYGHRIGTEAARREALEQFPELLAHPLVNLAAREDLPGLEGLPKPPTRRDWAAYLGKDRLEELEERYSNA